MKRLKLSGLLATLPDRVAYAKKAKLSEIEFLELALQDEVDRRDQKNLSSRITRAGFEEEQTFEGFDWDAPVTFDRDREDVIFLGPVGVGKTFLAGALGHAACRAGHPVLFLRADRMFQELHQSRADHSTEKLLAPDLLIIDDFALRRLTAEQSNDLYEVILERHRRASTIVTSNRTIDEWIPLFDDPILAQSALDRLAHNAYQIVMEGDSYRKRQRPGEPQAPAPRPRKRRRSI
jgi:DNA replication protein DnaC